eukprot:GHVU01097656.1.p2 GENE.GHVU01097656.1~~GHVU01097656.1.p2  ORF type:complete len:151 (-),score=8.05 GHVU01097656.1:214-666(-)
MTTSTPAAQADVASDSLVETAQTDAAVLSQDVLSTPANDTVDARSGASPQNVDGVQQTITLTAESSMQEDRRIAIRTLTPERVPDGRHPDTGDSDPPGTDPLPRGWDGNTTTRARSNPGGPDEALNSRVAWDRGSHEPDRSYPEPKRNDG